MYNHQLDTFMKVAELCSFSKAAEEQYISPSAIQQQINNLESNLGVKLFQRSRRAIKLTPAGELLYKEAPKVIELSREIRARLTALVQSENSEICIGTSASETIHLFLKWWIPFVEKGKECNVRFKPVSSLGHRKEWEDVDVMEGVYVGDFSKDLFDFLPLTEVPIVHAVWKDNPLAKKKVLSSEDMKGQTLVTISGNDRLLPGIRELRTRAEEQGMNVIEQDCYDTSTYNMCALNGYIIQTPQTDAFARPEMVVIPCDGNYSVPYGLYYRKDAPDIVKEFISFIKENNVK